MYLRMTHFAVKPGHWEEALRLVREQSIPKLEKQPGFLRLMFTGDEKTGKGVLITMWQSEEQALQYVHSNRVIDLVQPFVDMAAEQPVMYGYNVMIDKEF